MSYEVLSIPPFDKQLKRLVKKYPSLKKEFEAFIQSLATSPEQGVGLGYNCYKIRLAIASKGKGKSGGARVITHILVEASSVFLLAIYDKSEKDNLNVKELEELLKHLSDK
jgi:mRNA-degrading endonuclease RelE of RelBE toxin-antitoxin system